MSYGTLCKECENFVYKINFCNILLDRLQVNALVFNLERLTVSLYWYLIILLLIQMNGNLYIWYNTSNKRLKDAWISLSLLSISFIHIIVKYNKINIDITIKTHTIKCDNFINKCFIPGVNFDLELHPKQNWACFLCTISKLCWNTIWATESKLPKELKKC